MVRRHRAWHDIIALGHYTMSDYVGHGMTSPPLDGTHGRKMSGVACHQIPWAAHKVKLVGCGMTSPPLDSMHGWTTSVVA